MSDDTNIIPPVRLARWAAIVLIICLAVALYFRDGRRLPPITARASASDSVP